MNRIERITPVIFVIIKTLNILLVCRSGQCIHFRPILVKKTQARRSIERGGRKDHARRNQDLKTQMLHDAS